MIDSNKAREIAKNFLSQNHTIEYIKEPILEGHYWIVEANTMSFGANHTKKVKVDRGTGKIIDYR